MSWGGKHFPPVDLGLFNTANPVIYGNTLWYNSHWKAEWHWPLDVPHMDRVYTQVMPADLRPCKCAESGAETLCVPGVDRDAWMTRMKKSPSSAGEDSEILGHVSLRGANRMQIFNNNWYPNRPERVTIMTEEVEDAVSVYDETLAYRPFLERGEVMNTASPTATDNGPCGRDCAWRRQVRR